ncbi:MAG: carboxypeptidase regulatory-like domain-containing protein [Oscillospiraceae bacterium]|nr:carboxypeptidase regulatory-like domain-containing protein [Oscillospiraceae bacterium]
MAKVFLIDVALCTGCDNCQLACKDEHVGNDWSPIAKPQPEIGQFWIKKNEEVCGTVPKVKVNYMPTLCNHCENPACVAAAKDGAVYQREDGLVIIDPEKAAGQKQIAEACPYGAIYWNEELDIPQKCTGCAHLLDNGYSVPRCVEVCPTDAIRFGEEEDLAEDLLGTEVLKPETGCKPRVHYRNLPGKFIAGTVYDPEEKECLIGAKVRLQIGGKRYSTFTDDFGDFWFKDLAIGKHNIYIDMPGYATYVQKDIFTKECINLGDIPMRKLTAEEMKDKFTTGEKKLEWIP